LQSKTKIGVKVIYSGGVSPILANLLLSLLFIQIIEERCRNNVGRIVISIEHTFSKSFSYATNWKNNR